MVLIYWSCKLRGHSGRAFSYHCTMTKNGQSNTWLGLTEQGTVTSSAARTEARDATTCQADTQGVPDTHMEKRVPQIRGKFLSRLALYISDFILPSSHLLVHYIGKQFMIPLGHMSTIKWPNIYFFRHVPSQELHLYYFSLRSNYNYYPHCPDHSTRKQWGCDQPPESRAVTLYSHWMPSFCWETQCLELISKKIWLF